MIVEFTSKMYLNMYFFLSICYFNYQINKDVDKELYYPNSDIYLLCIVYSGTSPC